MSNKHQIKLAGTVDYNPKYPPRDAKKGYVAKIIGREKGAMKYNREFLGSETMILPGDEGLYEVQNGDKKGGHSRYYYVVLSHPVLGLIRSSDCEDLVPTIAKMLDDGISIEDVLEVSNLRPHSKNPELMLFDAEIKIKTKKTDIESIKQQCLALLRDLSSTDRSAVIEAMSA